MRHLALLCAISAAAEQRSASSTTSHAALSTYTWDTATGGDALVCGNDGWITIGSETGVAHSPATGLE